MESSKAKRKTAAEAIDILATAYRSSSYLEKTTEQIVEMKNMVSWAPVPTTEYRTDCKEQWEMYNWPI